MPNFIDFFIVGAQKSGTTALDSSLRQHPEIQMSKIKEIHFFDNETINWSNPDYIRLLSQFDFSSNKKFTRGESTPIYMYWPNSIMRLHKYNPSAKLIICLRHPVLRAYSHWKLEKARGREDLSFGKAISQFGRRRITSFGEKGQRIYSYIERGYYSEQLENIFNFFPRNQVFIVRTDDLWLHNEKILSNIYNFLGISNFDKIAARKYIAPVDTRHLGNIDQTLFQNIIKLYIADIIKTEQITGISLSDWIADTYKEPMTL